MRKMVKTVTINGKQFVSGSISIHETSGEWRASVYDPSFKTTRAQLRAKGFSGKKLEQIMRDAGEQGKFVDVTITKSQAEQLREKTGQSVPALDRPELQRVVPQPRAKREAMKRAEGVIARRRGETGFREIPTEELKQTRRITAFEKARGEQRAAAEEQIAARPQVFTPTGFEPTLQQPRRLADTPSILPGLERVVPLSIGAVPTERPGIVERAKRRFIPGFEEERQVFAKEQAKIRAGESARLGIEAERISKRAGVTEGLGLIGERREAQARLQAQAKQIQSQLDKGSVSLKQAQLDIAKATAVESILLKKSAKAREVAALPGIEAAVKVKQTAAEKRLATKLRAATITGTGGFGIEEFVGRTTVTGKGVRHFEAVGIAEGRRALEIAGLPKLSAKITKAAGILEAAGKPVRGISLPISIFKAREKVAVTIPKQRQFFADVTAGTLRKPVTTAAIGAVSLATAGVGSFTAPSIALAAAKGSVAAKGALTVAGVAKVALPAAFLGTRAISIATAPTAAEARKRFGESLAFVGAGVAGGLIGSKIGGAAFRFKLARKPAVVERLRVEEISRGARETIIRTKGVVKRGKFEFPFKTKEAVTFKGQKFVRIATVKSTFLGKELPTIKTTFKGITQDVVAAGAPKGVQQFITGGLRIGKGKVTPVDFKVFGTGETIGKIGTAGFRTTIIKPPKTLKGITTFTAKQVVTPKITKFEFLPSLGKKGQLSFGRVRGFGRARGGISVIRRGLIDIPSPPSVPSPISIPALTTQVVPAFTPEVTALFPPTPRIITVLPFLSRTRFAGLVTPQSLLKLGLGVKPLTVARVSTGAISRPLTISPPKVGVDTLTTAVTQPSALVTPTAVTTPFVPVTPTFPLIPIVPILPFLPRGGFIGRRRAAGRLRPRGKFQPSLVAVAKGIFGKKPRRLTGLSIRPIPLSFKKVSGGNKYGL